MDVRVTLSKQSSDNIRSCSGRICPRPKQLSSAINCSASCSRTANTANHATALHSVNLCNFFYCYSPGDKMWSCRTKLICRASHAALCCIQVYQPMDHWSILCYSLLHFCLSYNVFCSHEPSSSAPYINLTQHMMYDHSVNISKHHHLLMQTEVLSLVPFVM